MEPNLAQLLHEELTDRKIEIRGPFAGFVGKQACIMSDEDKITEQSIRDSILSFADIIERDGKIVEFGSLAIPNSNADAMYVTHNQITVRRIKAYDIHKDTNYVRWDITYNVRQ